MSTIYDGPKTLEESGAVPASRMDNAEATKARIQRLIDSDSSSRSKRRALVKGLVDGNPPYRSTDLRRAGRADACNVNWRMAEAFLASAVGLFYDVFSESTTFATVTLEDENQTKAQESSGIATEEFQRLQEQDKSWDYNMQNSQFDMVLYGSGPLVFPDEWDWRPCVIPCRDVFVPDRAKSDITTWEECAVQAEYTVVQLYDKIRDTETASSMGWNVEETKKAIMAAHPKTREEGLYRSWEWHQDQLKTQSFSYAADASTIKVAHYYVREFPKEDEPEGRITHAVVEIDDKGYTSQDYLFKKVGRFEKWEHIIHPMYYDNQGGGFHHSVTGLGVKMYAALEFQNRLLCHLADSAFAPKVFFTPTTANNDQKFNLVRFGNYAKTPSGFQMAQTPVQGLLEEGIIFNREVSSTLASNLSTYRQNLQKLEGNPITATEVQQRASEQARLGKTQLSRFFNQLDWLYAEKYRRAVESSDPALPGGKLAKEFQKRCKDRGVTLAQLKKVKHVKATRIVGQGSEFLRQASLDFLLTSVAGTLPESGKDNLVADIIASRAGQTMVERYFPRPDRDVEGQDQLAFAMVQVAAAKDGVPPVVTDTQDHQLFAATFLKAAFDALSGVEQGADPAGVLMFADTLGPAIAQHIQLLAKDPSRQDVAKQLAEEVKKLGQAVDQLRSALEQQQQQQAQQQQEQARVMDDQQLKNFQVQQDEQRENAKFTAEQRRKQIQFEQDLVIQDAQSAANIAGRNNGG